MNMKLYIAAALLLMATYAPAQNKGAEIFQKNGAAIDGYDAVAFFTESKPVKGSGDYSIEWKNAKWLFASKVNLDSFRSNPGKYAPQYGGYCAYGCSDGHKAPTETDTWSVIDGRLYFNYNQKVKAYWDKNRPKFIEQANINWEKIRFTE